MCAHDRQRPGSALHTPATICWIDNYRVYVPPSCVGTRRCPLYIFYPGTAQPSQEQINTQRPLADKYGMILLVPEQPAPSQSGSGTQWVMDPNVPFLVREVPSRLPADLHRLDIAIKQVLRNFAIDPTRIALGGVSAGGIKAFVYGSSNTDVFSRVVAMSPGVPPMFFQAPRDTTAQFFLSWGSEEPPYGWSALQCAKLARQIGFLHVQEALTMLGHGASQEEYELAWRWLRDTWATPHPASRPVPGAMADSVVALTPDILKRIATFWTSFNQEPDSIVAAALKSESWKEITVPVGHVRTALTMVDMAVLAAKYPSVAADLRQAGLTAAQQETYWSTIIGANALDGLLRGFFGSRPTGKVDFDTGVAQEVVLLGPIPATQEKNADLVHGYFTMFTLGPVAALGGKP